MGGPRDDDLLFHHQHRQCFVGAEPIHGQYSLFITGVAVLCAIFYYLLYMITENVDLLFQVQNPQTAKNAGIS